MTILCATDFSPCAETAVQLASALGRRRSPRPVLIARAATVRGTADATHRVEG